MALDLASLGVIDYSSPDFHYGRTATQNAKPFEGIVFHHAEGDPFNLIRYGQREDKERGGAFGYHFYIAKDGRIYQGAPLEARTNHIKPPSMAQRTAARFLSNANALGISLVGAHEGATPEQLAAAEKLARQIMAEYKITPDRLFGHGELQSDRMHTEGQEIIKRLRMAQNTTQANDASPAAADDDLARRREIVRRFMEAQTAPTVTPPADDMERRREIARRLLSSTSPDAPPDLTVPQLSKGPLAGPPVAIETPDRIARQGPQATSATPVEPVQYSTQDAVRDAAKAEATIIADMQSGMQNVNPIAMAQEAPFGTVRRNPAGQIVVDIDGEERPISEFPPDATLIVTDPESGQTFAYAKTPELMARAREADAGVLPGELASLGRLLGYSVIGGGGVKPLVRSTPPKPDVAVTPSLAMQAPRVAAALESFPPTAGRVQADLDRALGEIAKAADTTAARIGPGTSRIDAGDALLRGVDIFTDNFKGTAQKLYDEVGKRIPPMRRFQMQNTADALRAATAVFEDTPAIAAAVGVEKYNKWIADLESGLTWAAARQFRTDIGEAIGKISGPMATEAQGRLKTIYAALSNDLAAAAREAGPEAAEAWTRANAYYRAGTKRIDDALGKLVGRDATPEQAIAKFMQMAAKDGGSANIRALETIVQSLPKEELRVVAASLLRTMGTATPGAQNVASDVFSPATFLTNWNRLSPAARTLIFKRGLPDDVAREITKLAEVVERAKQFGGQRNTSRTSQALTTFLTGGAALADPVTTALGTTAAYITARGMTNVTFLKALQRMVERGDTTMMERLARSDGPLSVEATNVLRLSLAPEARPTPAIERQRIPALPGPQ